MKLMLINVSTHKKPQGLISLRITGEGKAYVFGFARDSSSGTTIRPGRTPGPATRDRVANGTPRSIPHSVPRSSDESFAQLVDGAGHRLRIAAVIASLPSARAPEVRSRKTCENWVPVSYSFFLAHPAAASYTRSRKTSAILREAADLGCDHLGSKAGRGRQLETGRRPWGNNADYLLTREWPLT
jgi:hypothetical protein